MDNAEKEVLTKRVFSGGFGSELRVRKIFADEGFDSWTYYYPDKDDPSVGGKGGTAREVDILAHVRRGELNAGDFQYHIIGEVKKGHTWILGDAWPAEIFEASGARCAIRPDWLTNTCLVHRGDGEGPRGGPDAGELTEGLEGLSLLPTHVSTSIHQLRRKEDDPTDWYPAAVKLAKACLAFDPPPIRVRRGVIDTMENAHAIVPLVVFDGNILAATRELALEPRQHALLRFTFRSPNYPEEEMFIHFVSMQGLPAFLQRVRASEEHLSKVAKRVYLNNPPPYEPL